MRPCYLKIDLLDFLLAEYFHFLSIYSVSVLEDCYCFRKQLNSSLFIIYMNTGYHVHTQEET